MSTSTQVAAVAEGDRPPVGSERPGERRVVGHVAGRRPVAARGEQPPALDRRALAVGDHAVGRGDVTIGVRRAEAVDERREHRRVQEPLPRSARR